MQVNRIEDSEEFWIDVVEGSVAEGETIICVPLTGLARETAVKLASRLDITVFIQGKDYLFSTTKTLTKELLARGDETRH